MTYIPGSIYKRKTSDPFFTTTPFQVAKEEAKPSFWSKAKADIMGTSPSGVGAAIGQQVAGSLAGWGSAYEWAGTKFGWSGVEKAKSFSEKMDVWKRGNTREDQTTIEKYIGAGAGMGLYYVPGLGSMSAAGFVLKNSPKLAKLAGGSTMALLESGSEAGSVYDELKKMGRSEEEADDRAGKVFWTNVALGTITNRLGIFGDSEKMLKKMASSAIAEGAQEYGQAVISNVATDKKWDEGAFEAGKMGFVLGGVFGSVNITTDTKGAVKKNIEDKLNISPEKATKFVNEIQTLQKEERKPAIFRDIKDGTSKNILNLLHKEPTTKIEDIVKPADRAAQIMRGEVKIKEAKIAIKEKVIEKEIVEKPIEDLISHEGAPDKAKVLMNVEMIETGKTIEPILVAKEGKKFGIVDGQHRYEAYKQLGYDTVPTVEEVKIKPKPIKPVVGIGEARVRGLAKGVEAKAIESKIIDEFSDLPVYKKVSIADQANKATELLEKDPEKAKQVAMGTKSAPKGLLPESVFIAVENKAIEENDVNTLRDLATISGLTTEATTMGQRIRTLAERYKESPIDAIRDVVAAREDAFEGNVEVEKTKVTNEIKKEIKKAIPTKESWTNFINEIKC